MRYAGGFCTLLVSHTFEFCTLLRGGGGSKILLSDRPDMSTLMLTNLDLVDLSIIADVEKDDLELGDLLLDDLGLVDIT